jgi:hypothetical protein
MYADWRVVEGDRLRVMGPQEADLAGYLVEAEAIRDAVEQRMSIPSDALPATITLMIYRTEADADRGRSLLTTEAIHQTILHLVDGRTVDVPLVELVLRYAQQSKPISSLLQRGIAVAAARPLGELEAEARRLLEADEWLELGRLDYGVGYPEGVVDTEIGYLLSTILADHGPEALLALWEASANGRTFDTALLTVLGVTRQSSEDALVRRARESGQATRDAENR